MPKPKELELVFDRERETKNKQRFKERTDEKPMRVGVLYLTKAADEALGSPDVLEVTLRPGS